MPVLPQLNFAPVLGDYLDLKHNNGTDKNDIVTVSCEGIPTIEIEKDDQMIKVLAPLAATDKLIAELNQCAVFKSKYGDFSLADFDLWSHAPAGEVKINQPDGVIDAVNLIWRNLNRWGCNSGYGMQKLFNPNQDELDDNDSIDDGMGLRYAASYRSCANTPEMFITEYFHALFGGNNWHTGSGRDKHTFMHIIGSWSTTAQSEGASNAVTGVDRWHMGWKRPDQQYLISAIDGSGDELPTDISIASHPHGGTFYLRDFVTWGDSIRIKLPHLDWQAQNSDSKKNQYLWLENRQLKSTYDRNRYGHGSCAEQWSEGLYAQIQGGKDIKEGYEQDIWVASWPHSHPNALGSYLMPLTAEGNWDFYRDTSQAPVLNPSGCIWDHHHVPTDMSQSRANPFTGYSDLFSAVDHVKPPESCPNDPDPTDGLCGNGILHSQDDVTVESSWIEANGPVIRYDSFGDSQDAFSVANGNTKLGIAENPAAVPVYTRRANSKFKHPVSSSIESFENRTIWLNGLSVEILEEQVVLPGVSGASTPDDGAIKVRIHWDDTLVDKNTRWTGNIVLQNDTADPLQRQARVELADGATICIDRGRSPTDYYAGDDGFFTQPSCFAIKSGAKLHLRPNSSMDVVEGSTVLFEPGATLQHDLGAQLYVNPNGTCHQHDALPPCPDCWTGVAPNVDFCSGDNAKVVTAQICSLSADEHTFAYQISGRPAIASPTIDGPVDFTFLSPNPVTVPGNTCVDVDIEVQRPNAMDTHGDLAWYDIQIVDLDTGTTHTANGTLRNTRNWCLQANRMARLDAKTPSQANFTIRNTEEKPMSFTYQIAAVDQHRKPARSVVLNGKPAGEPTVGKLSLRPGETRALRAQAHLSARGTRFSGAVVLSTNLADGKRLVAEAAAPFVANMQQVSAHAAQLTTPGSACEPGPALQAQTVSPKAVHLTQDHAPH